MPHTHPATTVSAAQSPQQRSLRHSAWHLGALAALGCTLAWGPANAQALDATGQGKPGAQANAPVSSAPAAADSQELSEGEVTRWNPSTGKITLRHGELKNLAMPPMTMVFTVQDPAQASQIKKGDKVRFRAEQVNGAFVVTHLEAMN